MAGKIAISAKEQEKEVQTVENTTETEKTENGANTDATEAKETGCLVYIGPTLPAGQLKCNKIFCGTAEEIKKELQLVLEKYPLVEKMLVPVSELAVKKDKVKTAGNILNKYYSDLVSAAAATKEV